MSELEAKARKEPKIDAREIRGRLLDDALRRVIEEGVPASGVVPAGDIDFACRLCDRLAHLLDEERGE